MDHEPTNPSRRPRDGKDVLRDHLAGRSRGQSLDERIAALSDRQRPGSALAEAMVAREPPGYDAARRMLDAHVALGRNDGLDVRGSGRPYGRSALVQAAERADALTRRLGRHEPARLRATPKLPGTPREPDERPSFMSDVRARLAEDARAAAQVAAQRHRDTVARGEAPLETVRGLLEQAETAEARAAEAKHVQSDEREAERRDRRWQRRAAIVGLVTGPSALAVSIVAMFAT